MSMLSRDFGEGGDEKQVIKLTRPKVFIYMGPLF